ARCRARLERSGSQALPSRSAALLQEWPSVHYKIVGYHAGVERHRQSAAYRLSDEGEPADERAADARAVGRDGSVPENRGAPEGQEEIRPARRSAVRERQH